MEAMVVGQFVGVREQTLMLRQDGRSGADVVELFVPQGVSVPALSIGANVGAVCFIGQKKRTDGQGYKRFFALVKEIKQK